MTFDSPEFLIFLPLVVAVYWMLPHTYRKYWLLAASYFFYMYWNPVFIMLLLLSTAVDYFCGIGLEKYRETPKLRKALLLVSVCVNLGLLFSFKYLDFFGEIINSFCALLAIPYRVPAFHWILPVGISFYTFQTMSYTIDVYRGKVPAERDPVIFALYVTFFPQLVAGPIENARNLMPQLKRQAAPEYDDFAAGIQLIISGFFRKVVIADSAGRIVDRIYGCEGAVDGAAVVVATVLFAVQIYCDFAGYSEIAAGTARLMGIRLMRNFDRPYLSAGIREFWRRWHISLSTWFTNYIYIPLGGSRKGIRRQIFTTIVVFGASGLWHGAKWTFVLWGLLHGGLLVLELLLSRGKKTGLSGPKRQIAVVLTFCAVTFSWIFFRSGTLEQAFTFVGSLFTPWDLSAAVENLGMTFLDAVQIGLMLLHLPMLHTLSKAMDHDGRRAALTDITYVYYLMVILTAWMIRLENNQVSTFIYFQF